MYDPTNKVTIRHDPLIVAEPYHLGAKSYWVISGPRVLRGGRVEKNTRASYGTIHLDGKIRNWGGKGAAGGFYGTYLEIARGELLVRGFPKPPPPPPAPKMSPEDAAVWERVSHQVREYVRTLGYTPIAGEQVVPSGDGVFLVIVKDAKNTRTGRSVLTIKVPRNIYTTRMREAFPLPQRSGSMKLGLRSGRMQTRDYEYIIYPSPRVEGNGTIVRPSSLRNDASKTLAIRMAKEHRGSGIYSVTKGRFIGWVNYNGNYVPFR